MLSSKNLKLKVKELLSRLEFIKVRVLSSRNAQSQGAVITFKSYEVKVLSRNYQGQGVVISIEVISQVRVIV